MRTLRRSIIALAVVHIAASPLVLPPARPAAAEQDSKNKIAGSLAVYFGMVPGEIGKGHAPDHPERTMHGGARA